MTAPSVFCLSKFLHAVDGMVVGPAWTDHLSRELLRALRLARPAAPDPDQESPDDFAMACRVYHEVLTLCPGSAQWPVFAYGNPRPSLFKHAVVAVAGFDNGALDALCRLDEHEHLLATNVARWLLRMPQQASSTVVFVTPPAAHSPRPRSRTATAREVAAVA